MIQHLIRPKPSMVSVFIFNHFSQHALPYNYYMLIDHTLNRQLLQIFPQFPASLFVFSGGMILLFLEIILFVLWINHLNLHDDLQMSEGSSRLNNSFSKLNSHSQYSSSCSDYILNNRVLQQGTG